MKHYDFSTYMTSFDLTQICRTETLNPGEWFEIAKYQDLSEEFIREFADQLDWEWLLRFQKLSASLFHDFSDRISWLSLSQYQELSEELIQTFRLQLYWPWISKYQKLSEQLRETFKHLLDLKAIADSWWYKDKTFKKEAVKSTGLYECHDDFFLAFKGIRSDRYSAFNFQYQYLPGETYKTFADHSSDEDSFGFSAWTKEEAAAYCNALVVKCKVRYEDVARVVHDGGKIRCSRMTILD